jgi:hypothetical protein
MAAATSAALGLKATCTTGTCGHAQKQHRADAMCQLVQ